MNKVKTAKELIKLAKQLIAADIPELELDLPVDEVENAGDAAADALSDLNDLGSELQEEVTDTVEEIDEELDEEDANAKRIVRSFKVASKQQLFLAEYEKEKNEKEFMVKQAKCIHSELKLAAMNFVNAVEVYHDAKVCAKKMKKANITKVAWGGAFIKNLFKKHPEVEDALKEKEDKAYNTMFDLTKNLKKKVVAAYNAFVKAFENACAKIQKLVDDMKTAIQTKIKQAVNFIKDKVSDFIDGAIEAGKFLQALGKNTAIFVGKATLGALFIAIGGVTLGVITAAKGLGKIGKFLGDTFVSAVKEIAEKLTTARNKFKAAIEEFGAYSLECKNKVEANVEALEAAVKNGVDTVTNEANQKIQEIVAVCNEYDAKLAELAKKIQEAIKTPYVVIKGSVKAIVDGISADVEA